MSYGTLAGVQTVNPGKALLAASDWRDHRQKAPQQTTYRTATLLRYQAVLHGIQHEVEPAIDAELAVDRRKMVA
jgi:hypothetical protein